ncbi:hypothetical protein B0H34DRAFT_660306 [Crassisporium funariophilum]|nr:hypothetical protein B0H34DRAFT_660306 [Crassisporium funariophilum]
MATLSQVSLNVKETSISTTVPDDDVARLMYYLRCVTVSLNIDILADELVDYKNYHLLTAAGIALVFKFCLELSPDEFLDKLIFLDNNREVLHGSSDNTFLTISAACDVVSVQRDIIIAGKVQNVTRVMFYNTLWLDTYYNRPIERNAQRIARVLLGTRHCIHCMGTDGVVCKCLECPRSTDSECQPLLNLLFGALSTNDPPSYSTIVPTKAPIVHECTCDGCGWNRVEGIRYKCGVCADYDLCQPCYQNNRHELAHEFMKIDSPGSKPLYLAPRAPRATQSSPAALSPLVKPPAVKPPATKPAASGYQTSNTRFYNDMTTPELKAFLKEHCVAYDDIFDKETLCRRVWEAHCDSMTVPELNAFVRENSISTADCRDIASRRQKVKEAFQASRPAAQSKPRPPRFYEDDRVILTGLNRAEMNGKTAIIVRADCGDGRAEVSLEAGAKTFKVKFENLVAATPDNDDGSDYLD